MTKKHLDKIKNTSIGRNLEKYEGGDLQEWIAYANKCPSLGELMNIYKFTFAKEEFHEFYVAVRKGGLSKFKPGKGVVC